MDWIRVRNTCLDFLKKYRYVILVVAVGLVLMSLPDRKTTTQQPEATAPTQEETEDPARELEQILSAIEGAGKVRVMLTVAKGAETLYQSNVDSDTGEQTSSNRQDTVLITGADRAEQGLIRQVNPPQYQGAIIICQGADKASVRLSIVEAVSCVTGLRSDCISVLKMK